MGRLNYTVLRIKLVSRNLTGGGLWVTIGSLSGWEKGNIRRNRQDSFASFLGENHLVE